MKTNPTPTATSYCLMKTVMRVSVLILIAFLVVPLYIASSASFTKSPSPKSTMKQAVSSVLSQAPATTAPTVARDLKRLLGAPETAHPLLPLLQASPPETVTIYQSDCMTEATEFELGQTVCAKVTGAPTPSRPTQVLRRLNIVNPNGYILKKVDVTGSDETIQFTLPDLTTSEIGGETQDNRGGWSASSVATSTGRAVVATPFTVKDPDNAAVDLVVTKVVAGSQEIGAGATVPFTVFVVNYGPDDAADVEVTDAVPANTTFVSAVRNSGENFTCSNPSGTPKCTIASLPSGGEAQLTFTFEVSAGATPGTTIDNTAVITSATAETYSPDNSSSASARVTVDGGEGENCSLTCPANIVVTANATQGGQQGAFVNYSAAGVTGDCGSVTNNPPSGSFFTVGTHTVTSTASTGATCTFTVKVVNTPPPTISCPTDKTATAPAGSDEATVAVGTPTFTPTDGTVVGLRSDSSPEEPKELTDPYPVGVTGITWTVTDADGRTASCRQTITVIGSACGTDTENPTITAPPDVTVGTGAGNTGCSVALDDELGQAEASDNCSVTVTISGIPPGNVFVPGTPYTLTYTATDGAGNTATDTQVVTVIDDTPPVIVAPEDASYVCQSDVPAGHPSQATRGELFDPEGNPLPPGPPFDNCGTPAVTVSDSNNGGAGSASSPLIITRTYTATDAAGNTSSDSQIITVIDGTPPTIAVNGANPQVVECHTAYTELGATASDNCSAPFAATPSGNVDVNVPGTYIVTYTATDPAGNTTTATRTVNVVDTQPPTISCPSDILVDFNPAVGGAVVTYSAPVGTDSCAGTLTATQTSGLPSGATFPLGTTINSFTVTDGAGHTASCSFSVTVALTSIVGLDSVTISGAGPVDSYDSNGGYPATKGSLANVVSNGTITMSGSAKVFGSVRSTNAGVVMSNASQVTGNATAGTTVSRSGSATVGGTITNNQVAPTISLQAVSACSPYSTNSGISGTYSYNASTGNLSLSGVNSATLANGTYCFNNLSVGGSAQLNINGPVTIKLTGTLSTSGAARINNTTLIPSNLRILSSYTGSNGVSFSNSSSAYLVIYAPRTSVTISGAAPLFGTVAGKSLTISNSGKLHYDTRLQTIWPDLWQLIFGP